MLRTNPDAFDHRGEKIGYRRFALIDDVPAGSDKARPRPQSNVGN